MVNLFGLDISSIVENAIEQAGDVQVGVLTKADGTQIVCKGFIGAGSPARADTIATPAPGGATKMRISLLGKQFEDAGVEPEVFDTVVFSAYGSQVFTLSRLRSVDPARALYVFESG